MKVRWHVILVAAATIGAGLGLWAGPSEAATSTSTATYSGTQENPPNASTGTGRATVTTDTTANTVTVQVTFSGLTAIDTAAHIHQGPAGSNGPVVVPFTGFPVGVTSGSYQNTLSVTSALAAQIASNPSGFYVNIHTTTFPGGEIRGQLAGAACTRGVTGAVPSVTANAGEYVCVVNASVGGEILANPGSSLVVFNSQVNGNIGGDAPARFVVCGNKVALNIGVQNATGWVLIGDRNNDEGVGCAGNVVSLDISSSGNKAGTEITGNSLNRDVFLVNTTGAGPASDDTAPEVAANQIGRFISCGGNTPAPTNGSAPNTVTPANRFYQCASL
jgi:hypothetical protein